jgi:hypothetical protein
LFGYITWQNRGKNQTNKYYFREDSQFQSILQSNLRLRSKMSLQQKQLYNDRKLLKGINNKKVVLIESLKK